MGRPTPHNHSQTYKPSHHFGFLFFFHDLLILCALVFCLYVCLCESDGSPGTGVINSYDQPCRCWELNAGLVEEQPVLLITEPSLSISLFISKHVIKHKRNMLYLFTSFQINMVTPREVSIEINKNPYRNSSI